MTVAEIHSRLKGRSPNLVSIYRTVNLLSQLGLLRVADTTKGTHRFELAERFTEYQVLEGDEVTGAVPTYRGEGQCFG